MYKDCEIPAKLFFKISHTGDYTLLGEGTPQEQAQAFDNILDEFYRLDPSSRQERAYRKQARIGVLNLWITLIRSYLYSILYTPMTTEERLELINDMNDIKGANVKFDKNKPILDEYKRVEEVVLGYFRNEINQSKTFAVSDAKNTEQELLSFELELANISVNLKISVPGSITLKEFIAYRITNREMYKSFKQNQK